MIDREFTEMLIVLARVLEIVKSKDLSRAEVMRVQALLADIGMELLMKGSDE